MIVPQQKSSIDPNQQVDIKQETESKLDIEKTNDLDGGNASVSEKGYHDSKCSGEGSDQQDCFRPVREFILITLSIVLCIKTLFMFEVWAKIQSATSTLNHLQIG